MLSFIKNLFQTQPKVDLRQLIKEGAVILDVRTKGEYQGGHVKGSINIPLDQLNGQLSKLKKEQAVITCCASGMRSGAAKSVLKANGFTQVHNGGSWMAVDRLKH